MLDMKWIRDNEETVRETARLKGIALPLAELLAADEAARRLRREADALRTERNALARQVEAALRSRAAAAGGGGAAQDSGGPGTPARADAAAEGAAAAKAQAREIGARLETLEAELLQREEQRRALLLRVPNPVSADTPQGGSDADNVERRRCGEPPAFGFAPRDHVELGEMHALLDLQRGVKAGGTRSYVLKNAGALLHLAVQRLAVDVLMERGFELMDVPVIVRPEALARTGFFPGGEDQTYVLEGECKMLAGTSEVSLVSLYSDEFVDLKDGPLRLAGISPCFRSEVGSAGRDVRGLYRVHQFAKVEQVVICRGEAEESEAMLQEITANAERILELLELPYRVMAVCTGDMSLKTHKQYDIETWMPGRAAYGETHSASNLLDFQARRSNIRYRDGNGQTRFCHTLNNTAVATPRILIPLLENHQREDGSVYIPHALRKYMNGLECLIPGSPLI